MVAQMLQQYADMYVLWTAPTCMATPRPPCGVPQGLSAMWSMKKHTIECNDACSVLE